MKLSRFLIIAVFVTFFSVLYVWQQTEIIRLAYTGQKSQTIFQDSLDNNSVLRYNLKRKTSLINIGNRVEGCKDFQMPESYCLVKLASQKENFGLVSRVQPKSENVLARLFGIKMQAQAQTIEAGAGIPSNRSKYFGKNSQNRDLKIYKVAVE
ncbi:MAG: hypothetical protein WDL87_01610 [Candidatus Omnitrophota bacterium]|jgi:hypothetical protein